MDVLRIPAAVTSRLPGRLGETVGAAGSPVVSVVRLHGVISAQAAPVPRQVLNAASVEKVLERAFAPDRLAAVALVINSPGGSPTQSQLIGDRIRGLAAEKDVPVLAFCEDVAASGGYWLACAADEIYACSTSIVGSIGVISAGFGLEGLIDRWGVTRRLHTAGGSKSRLDPFLPEKPEDVAWLTGLQEQLHERFVGWVRERRGDRLDSGTELFDGEVWLGERARELGLIDGIGTAHDVLTERFPDAEQRPVDQRKPLLARLGAGGAASVGHPGVDPAAIGSELLTAVETRATWARFGL
ncbi:MULTISPECIES: S49 family peptidase [Pseudonocardia]|uniref:Serine protease n=2 Tax=Pseudonocardia TaxID=1847 RepID=A0ABQ0S4M4_9PSEU|nr:MULTISPECIES: S49 family peptidase [Pseudonocardia]OSY38743.1 putative signal peptide peptidase SppA [Pseudonocardia autotrophica]TDN74945.1 signal peptide peptidase SppA [Pseudonocardia autotrophica]BBF98884.1 serine protease [Pseudonocardia autotrophica]GEC27836.1 serine protease [Pseudonocardia saturnea]